MIIFATKYDDATQNSFSSAQSVVDESDFLLFENNAVNEKLALVLNDFPNKNLMCFSHGTPDFWYDNNDKPALFNAQIETLNDRKTFVYACNTALVLGRKIGQYGNTFYWGYNRPISTTELDLKDIFLFIKQNFILCNKEQIILDFFNKLKNICEEKADYIAENYPHSSLEDYRAVCQIWTHLELHCNHKIYDYPQQSSY